MPRIRRKTSVLSLRIEPTVKEAIQEVADRERRSVAAMVEVMALEYCRQHPASQRAVRKPVTKS